MSITDYLNTRRTLVEQSLDEFLPDINEYPEKIHKAMRHSIFAGGKRLRPILVIASCEIVGGTIKQAIPTACAIECIHTYSLIHDDLPCMDDDDFRRGIPACHKVFGEGIAVLAGDALLTFAFQLLANNCKLSGVSERNALNVIAEIGKACGTSGLIGGQVMDLVSENKTTDLNTLKYIHQHKTGALITASIRSGAILADASTKELNILTEFGNLLGLVFQITDDILDVEGALVDLGKTPGKDQQKNKATFPALYGLRESKIMAENYTNEAISLIGPLGEKGQILVDIANYILKRNM